MFIKMQSVRCGSQAAVIYSKNSAPNDCSKWSLKICMSSFSLIVINQAGVSCTHSLAGWLLTPRHWLQAVYAVVLNHRRAPSFLADERQSRQTHALVCLLKKQTTTIILISALFRPLQQSSRLSSEGTWVRLIHHREYLNHIAAIVRRSLLLIRSATTMPTSCFLKAAWLRESLGCHPEIIFTQRSKSK